MKPREIKKLSALLKAISDPTRRAIFELVLNSEKKESISTVTKEFKMTRQGITKHLKMLEAGDLVRLKRIGRVTYCYAEKEPLNRAVKWVSQFIELDQVEPINMTKEARQEVGKPAANTEKLLADIEDKEQKLVEAKEEKINVLLQMSIDPNDPGQPVKIEPAKDEPVFKEPREKPIEVTDNQLDIYGIRKEPKVNEDSQLEMF
ncbi:MAG: ArsR/SmtB family transcription factor [Flavobacteriales bacterium]